MGRVIPKLIQKLREIAQRDCVEVTPRTFVPIRNVRGAMAQCLAMWFPEIGWVTIRREERIWR